MSIIIESADLETMILPPPEGESEEIEILPEEPLVVAPVPSETTIAKMDSYDEDLNANPFFQSFMVTCPDLFSQCVQEQWLICVPRRDSLPKYAFTVEDFTQHVLRPISKSPHRSLHERHFSGDSDGLSSCLSNNGDGDADGSFVSSRSASSCGGGISPVGDENTTFSFSVSTPSIGNTTFLSNFSGPSSNNVSGVSTNNLKGNWNYRTLSHVNVEYSGSTITLDIEVPLRNSAKDPVHDYSSPGALVDEGISVGNNDSNTSVVFSDSELNDSKQDEQSLPETEILPQNIPKVQLRKEVLFEETFYTNNKQKYKVLCVASPLNSKVDIEDENFGNSGLGLWNLTSLRDCIDFLWVKGSPKILSTFDAYIKLFQHNHRGLENFPLKVQKDLVNTLYLKCLNYAIAHGGIVKSEPQPDKVALNEFFLQRLKLATETYVLNGIYRSLISALTSFVSAEDSKLNKVMRNLTELTPQDLDIKNIHWDNLTRARHELGRLNTYSSPLGKLTCMKRTLRYLRPEPCQDPSGAFPLTADELIPIWVYLVVKNPLGNWTAQLEFLRHFRFSVEPFSPLQLNATKDNENSFYITTLEASLEHLRSGKVLGISDHERDVGMPCDLGEAWLHCVHAKAMECSDSPLGEMFDVIRLGNCPRLEELIEEFEYERLRALEEKRKEHGGDFGLDSDQKTIINIEALCHPLCQCESCVKILMRNAKEMEEQEQELLLPAIELKTSEGLTMLHVACIYGRPKIVEYLIDAGADLEAKDVDGMTALHFAASRGHQNALLLLLDAGANIEPRNIMSNTPLHLAAQNGHEGCVKALIYDAERCGKKLHISSRNQKGDTPLHFASRWGFQGIVQILVEHGAAIKVHNVRHVTPMDCAHDIHILKILQRSLRRRSLVEINHGDFINIEMVQKEESGGIVMLITEPKEPAPVVESRNTDVNIDLLVAENNTKNVSSSNPNSRQTSRAASRNTSRAPSRGPSRKSSTVTVPDLIFSMNSGAMTSVSTPSQIGSRSRKVSNIVNPMKGIDEEQTKSLLQDVAEHLQQNENAFEVSNVKVERGINQCKRESEHVRKVSVQSLEDCRVASAESAFTGLVTFEDTKERDIKKIFSALNHDDLPLALFYLGIPADEELHNPENELTTVHRIPACHPLCPCVRCVAKNAGLGLGLDVKNSEGYTVLHACVQKRLESMVKILIRFGADINAQSEHDKKTPLDLARDLGFHEIEDVLVACGAESSKSFAPEPHNEFWGTE